VEILKMPLPAATDFTGPNVTEAQFKTAITDMREHIAGMEGIAAGAVVFFPRSTPPAGWLKANGAAVSRTTYSALFAAIGTSCGVGDGTTTFNVPDLRGEFVRGLDDGRGVDSARALASAQTSQNLSHTHSTDSQGAHTHSVTSAVFMNNYGYNGSENGDVFGSASTGSGGAHTHTAQANGGTESRPRNLALLACIKF
jgi:phage-related tail fiber protein